MIENDKIIDGDSITNSKADISISNGFSFGPATRAMAVAMLILGFFAFFMGGGGYFIGATIIMASLFALTAKHGTEISFSNNYIREYSWSFGFKTGKWIPTIMLPDITVMKLGKKAGIVGIRTGGITMERDVSVNEVYLLSANHRKRILVKVCQSQKEGVEFAKEIAQKMGKNFVAFNPPVSEKTKARR